MENGGEVVVFGLSDALSQLTTVVSKCVEFITGNPILYTMFVASLVIVGFKIFKRAKKAAKA